MISAPNSNFKLKTMIYGFSDRETAVKLKEMADSQGKRPSQSSTAATESGPRVFLVSLKKDLEPASKSDSGSLIPSTGSANLLKRSLSTEELETRKNDFSQTDYEIEVKSVSGNAVPKTSDPSNPEELHLAVQDSFGTLYLIPEASELFGVLASGWTLGDEEAQSIELSEGFERPEPFTAYPAPTLSESLTAGTAVTCRFIKALGKWFFFRPSGGENAAEVNASGTALGGMGKHDDGLEIWASRLAAGSDPVHVYQTPAVRTRVEAVGSEDDSPWIRFPTGMTGDPEGVTHVRNDFYRANGKIWRKEFFGTVYADDLGTLYYPTFQTFNGSPTWKSAESWIYTADEKWMKDVFLGTLPDDPQIEPDGNFGAAAIEELGLFLYEKPCWECSDEYGVYLPKEGTPAEGEILFGVPMFQVDAEGGFISRGGFLTRSLKREFQKEKSEYFWKYSGELELYLEDEGELLKYSGAAYRETASGEWKWILGAYGHTENGWFELDGEPNHETDRKLKFCVVEKEDKPFAPADLVRKRFSETIEEKENEFRIRDSKTACWRLSREKTADVSFTFAFQFPEESEPPEIQDDKTVALDDLLLNDPELPEFLSDDEAETFVIGLKGDPAGWFEAPWSDFEETFTFLHGPIVLKELTLRFKAWVKGDFTENIWKTEPEIVT